jgi:hypothetical protein
MRTVIPIKLNNDSNEQKIKRLELSLKNEIV